MVVSQDDIYKAEFMTNKIGKNIVKVLLQNHINSKLTRPTDINQRLYELGAAYSINSIHYWLNKLNYGRYVDVDKVSRRLSCYRLNEKGVEFALSVLEDKKDFVEVLADSIIEFKKSTKPKSEVIPIVLKVYDSL